MSSRNIILDLFKGIAIIAVILYHAGLFTYGYLGVDIFLVIGGYLITKSILCTFENSQFSYWDYLFKRLVRLWPLALIITIVSLAVGYFTMLPDAFKNTCETAVGTCIFANNYVQYITSGNYWDISNDYKPLMHTWYLGIIFQFYLLYPLVFMLCHYYAKDFVKASRIVLCFISVGSLLFFISPGIETAVTFFLLPARLFEFAVGGLLALSHNGKDVKTDRQMMLMFLLFFVVLLLFVNDAYDIAKERLLLTVVISSLIILFSETSNGETKHLQNVQSRINYLFVLAPLGVASYSLYLWHQVIIAFYRYVFNNCFTVKSYLLIAVLSLAIGIASWLFIEKPISAYAIKSRKHTIIILAMCMITTCVISLFSLRYYMKQGVVRDVPELDVYLDKPDTWVPQHYNGRITDMYEKDFPEQNGKTNVLVVGDSYARDWMNIILESHIDGVNLSYSESFSSDLRTRIAHADIIFLACFGPAEIYSDYLPAMMKKVFYRVGCKSFDRGIGIYYNHRRDNRYYQQTIRYQNLPVNDRERIAFQGMYINLMDSIRNTDGTINIFTPEKRFISHDGLHLTKAGAQHYAKLIDVKQLIKNALVSR